MEDNRFQHYLVITDLLEAHVAALLEHERVNMIRAWESICRARQQLSRIYRWAIGNFPHSTTKWLIQFPGHVVRPNGDAYSLSQCYNITNWMAFWMQKHNNSCYHSLCSILDFDWLIHLQIIHANID